MVIIKRTVQLQFANNHFLVQQKSFFFIDKVFTILELYTDDLILYIELDFLVNE